MQDAMNQSANTFQRNGKNMLLGKRTNCLLVKDDVGKSKPFTQRLPAESFAFGKGSVFTESAGAGKLFDRLRCLLTYFLFVRQLLTITNTEWMTQR